MVVVNTCGFVESAKKDSIDTLLAAADTGAKVVAVGCLAERYGKELAAQLPEADAVLGFDSYADLSGHLQAVLDGAPVPSHTPGDRRTLLPISPVDRQQPAADLEVGIPGHAGGPTVLRKRLDDSPVAPLKLASGCDRRCSFCAIPSFRGAFVSRRPADVLAEARWLADHGVKELVLVSENSTSYGKDLGDLKLLESLLPALAGVNGIERVRLSYLQPAEMRPTLVEVLTGTEHVAPYFDMSFQHSSADGAAADAPVRQHRELPDAARPGARAEPDGRRAQQRHRRLPRRDRAGRRGARALPHRGPARRDRRLRLLRRGRHRGRVPPGPPRPGQRSTTGYDGSPPWPRSSPASGLRSGSASCWTS